MNVQASAVAAASTELKANRPLFWSIRRELWEHRAIYLGPLVASGLFLLGFLISLGRLPQRMNLASTLSPEQQHNLIVMPYDMAAGLMMLTQMLIAVFYCLDAFQSERRDRSILFWKSLPVSDGTTVLAKASVPFAILPILAILSTMALQMLIAVLSTIVLKASGQSAMLFEQISWPRMSFLVAYHIVTVHTLWHAPIYAWLLFVSAWARRATYLWAFLPILAAGFLEKILIGTTHLGSLLLYRLAGSESAVAPPGRMPIDLMTHLTPWDFFLSPGLWIGLGLTAAFLLGAARVRRNREPS